MGKQDFFQENRFVETQQIMGYKKTQPNILPFPACPFGPKLSRWQHTPAKFIPWKASEAAFYCPQRQSDVSSASAVH